MNGAIVKATIIENYRCFTSGETFLFDPCVTLLVGDQGVGKSTLLKGLHSIANWIEIELSQKCIEDGCSTYYFDTEKMNPRIQQTLSGIKNETVYKAHVLSHFKSHGETLKEWLLNPLKTSKNENAVVFIDEPESGLSVRSQYQLAKEIKKQTNKQFVIATHSTILMQEFKKVLSLEHKEWMSDKEFIKTQKHKNKKI